MADIAEIDKNMRVEKHPDFGNVLMYDIEGAPFVIEGVYKDGDKFIRMPEEVAKSTSEGVFELNKHSAGGNVRFTADCTSMAFRVEFSTVGRIPNMAMTGSAGFDIYEKIDGKWRYSRTFVPPMDVEFEFESVLNFCPGKREYQINFPLYSGLKKFEIGFTSDVKIEKPGERKIKKPVVFYGSSITQGGCASRPGMSYEAILARRFDFNYINLGFSGSAHGEQSVAQYIASLDMSAFVLDYDHNAFSPEELKQTHEPFFKTVREKHPELPIIMMSRPKYYLSEEEKERRSVVEETYKNAVAKGDKNVYFLDGRQLTKQAEGEETCDNCHPNDLGFMCMADAVSDVFKKIIKE